MRKMKLLEREKPAILLRGCFSLIEVMVSVTILGLISSLIYASFSRSLEVPEYLRNIQERYHKVRVAMERMSAEISMAYLSKHVDPNYDEAPKYIIRVKANDPGDRMDFTAFAHMKMHEDIDESDQCEIGYFLESDPDEKDQLNLMRREQSRIDQEPGWGGIKQVLAEDVVDFNVLVWDNAEGEWVEEWDTSQVEQFERIPEFISLELTIMDENEEEVTFYTKTQIALKTPVDLISL